MSPSVNWNPRGVDDVVARSRKNYATVREEKESEKENMLTSGFSKNASNIFARKKGWISLK